LAVSPNLGNPFEYRVAGILDKGYQFAPSFVGRLPIPLRFYLSVFSTIDQLSTQKAINPIDVVGPMTSYLRRVDELFDAARTDSYHWTRLQSGILPVEPDVLAVCNVMNMACRKWFQESLLDILKDQLRPVELIPIQVAVGLTESRNLG